jgi:CNT family concentrative nucleoside transporter
VSQLQTLYDEYPCVDGDHKLRIPEVDEPVTHRRVIVDRGEEDEKDTPVSALHAFAKGAVFGLIVVGYILFNLLTVLSLVVTINGLPTWIGRGFGIHQLTLRLVLWRYVFDPITFFIGMSPSTGHFSSFA